MNHRESKNSGCRDVRHTAEIPLLFHPTLERRVTSSAASRLGRGCRATAWKQRICSRPWRSSPTTFKYQWASNGSFRTYPNKPVRLQWENTTALQILKDTVAVEPGYTISLGSGVIHISRITIFDDRRNFLNIPINDFELSSEYVFHANNRLRKLVVELANPAFPKNEAGCAGSFGVGSGDQKASFHLRNIVVRDILDKFVTSAGFNIWLVTFPELPAITEKDFFKSISIFSPGLPSSELPAWDLLLPGYDPVRRQMGVGWKQGLWRSGS